MAIRDLLRKRRITMAYKILFNKDNPHAREVLKDMCAAHGVFDGGFDPDPYLNAFESGERNVVLRILTITKMPLQDILDLAEGEEE